MSRERLNHAAGKVRPTKEQQARTQQIGMDGGSYLKQQSEKQKKRKGKRKKEEKKYAPDSQGQFFLFAHEINLLPVLAQIRDLRNVWLTL